MSAIASMTIADGKATPENHVFNPVRSTPPTYRENEVAGVPTIGEAEVISNTKIGVGADTVNRVRITMRIPVLETASGGTPTGYVAPPKVAYYHQANLDFLLPNRGTSDQRKDLRVLIRNLLADAQVVSSIDNVEQPY